MNKPTKYEEEIAREIVAKFDTDKQVMGEIFFYDPLRKWIAQALAAYRLKLAGVATRLECSIDRGYHPRNRKQYYENVTQAILNFGGDV